MDTPLPVAAPRAVPSRRVLPALYSALAYGVFAASLVAVVVFLTGIGRPPLVDRPGGLSPQAIGLDAALLAIFAAHHSVFARSGAKRLLLRVLPAEAERSTYVLVASLALLLLVWQWRPLGGTIWALAGPAAAVLTGLAWAGWAGLVASTFMIDHFDFFGLRQGWQALTGRHQESPKFRVRWFYRWVRHPMMTCLLVIFWAAPVMTLAHLLFAVAGTGYIVLGTRLEERDLLRAIPEYADYRARVGGLLPRLRSAGRP